MIRIQTSQPQPSQPAAKPGQGRGRPKSDKPKVHVTLRLDADVVEHFRRDGRGWQGRINETLRALLGV